jgi:hypothetical protein
MWGVLFVRSPVRTDFGTLLKKTGDVITRNRQWQTGLWAIGWAYLKNAGQRMPV